MYNQTEAILSQYELEIHEVKKGRGTYICQTNQGMKVLVPFRGSNEKSSILQKLLEQLPACGFSVEQLMTNEKGEVVTTDEITGERFLLKDYIAGAELNVENREELRAAVSLLALYHRAAEKVAIELPVHYVDGTSLVVESRRRHYRELIKTRNYIRGRKKKSSFEQMFMASYAPMLAIAERSMKILEKEEQAGVSCILCHGDVNQHNILCENGVWHLVNFENYVYSWKMLDLANFLRKILEKHNWEHGLGVDLIEVYKSCISLNEREWRQLYGLLLFPEKFWKITNHYMNSRKTWISGRDIDKLKKVVEQEEYRLYFLENLFSFSEESCILEL